jgi:signal recognition particle subunit SRP54
VFELLTERLERTFERLRGRGRLSVHEVDQALREVRAALIEADVDLEVVRDLVETARRELVGAELSKALAPGQQVVKAVHGALVETLGGEGFRMRYAPAPPTVVLLVGLQGAGKTTAAAKLGRWFRGQGRNPLLVAADLQRPAATEQLLVLGEQAGVPVHVLEQGAARDPVVVAASGVARARDLGRDVVVIDTAGRFAVDEELMAELRSVAAAVAPHYSFLVLDAMTGQEALPTARRFAEAVRLDGVVLTKVDGDARGGAVLSVRHALGVPVAFASSGEHLVDFDAFVPERMASRILGMGDVLTLIERAEREMDERAARAGATALLEGRFTLEDFLAQLEQLKRLGPLSGVLSMLPGLGKQLRQARDLVDEAQLGRVEAIIRSMTPLERQRPEIVDGSRRRRIASGSGTTVQEVNQLLRQFEQLRGVMRRPGALLGALGAGPGLFGGPGSPPPDELAALAPLPSSRGSARGGTPRRGAKERKRRRR